MPNHCHNRVTFYASGDDEQKSQEQIAKLKEIFSGRECIFGQIIPEPDWHNTPLLTSDNQYGTKYGKTESYHNRSKTHGSDSCLSLQALPISVGMTGDTELGYQVGRI